MNVPAAQSEETEATSCFVCGKPIVDGHWFARLRQDSRRLIFCQPRCVEVYLERKEAADANWPMPRASDY